MRDESASIERGTGRDGFRVVLAHDVAATELAVTAAAELHRRGQQIELVALAGDDAPLLEACARNGGRGLFVVARGAGLDGARVDRLREVLRDLGVPMSRSLALALETTTLRGFVDRVLIVARRIGATVEQRAGLGADAQRSTLSAQRSTLNAQRSTLDARRSTLDAQRSTLDAEPAPEQLTHASLRPPTAPHVHLGPSASPLRSRIPVRLFLATLGAAAAIIAVALVPQDDPETPPDTTASLPADASRATEPTPLAAALRPATTPVADDEPILDTERAAVGAATLDEDAPAVIDALRKREVRALDVFVVSPESKKPAAFAGAKAHCDALKVGGLGDWRLPEIGELISMSRAKMVRKGSFWSATKGDTFGDLRLVLVVKRERISPIPAGWDGGRVICVRERA